MKIVMITGSPHKRGTTAALASEFVQGAAAAGHEIFQFDAAFEDVRPCIACDRCQNGLEPCVHNDAMTKLNPYLEKADLVVFVTPLYYYGMTAQIKMVIDRFYAINNRLVGAQKKAMLIAAAADEAENMGALLAHYYAVIDYLQWENAGELLAGGCAARSDVDASDYPLMAYKAAKNLK